MKKIILALMLVISGTLMAGCQEKNLSEIEATNINNATKQNEIDDKITGELTDEKSIIKTTYYFKNNKAVNAFVEIVFKDEKEAQNLYKWLQFNSNYIDVKIAQKKISYSYSENGFAAYKNMSKDGITKILNDTNQKIS